MCMDELFQVDAVSYDQSVLRTSYKDNGVEVKYEVVVTSSGEAYILKDNAIRVNVNPIDGFQVAKELAEVVKNGSFDLVLAGKESADYNGQMVPGMLASLSDFNFINGCVGLEVDGTSVSASREIDGGTETLSSSLPLIVGGQKGIVEEKDLRIPNMRGIMMARKKPLQVLEAVGGQDATSIESFEKPAAKGAVKLVDADNVDELINLLHNEAKVI